MLITNILIIIFLVIHFIVEILNYGATLSNQCGHIGPYNTSTLVSMGLLIGLGIYVYHSLRIGGLLV